jgi:hypothetical protein
MTFDEELVWKRLASDPGQYYTGAAEPERESFRQMVKRALHTNTVLVEFVKADGTVRAMKCTLSEDFGAKYTVNEAAENPTAGLSDPGAVSARKINNDVCKIWDVDQAAWRSFRWDRLKRIDFKIG